MITEKDLQEAIAECKGQRNPTSSTCIKLAAFLTIQRELFGSPEPIGYSFASGPVTTSGTIDYSSGTEFSEAIQGEDPSRIWPIIDEAMTALMVYDKPLYNAVMNKIK